MSQNSTGKNTISQLKIIKGKTLRFEDCKRLVLGVEPWVTYALTEKSCRRIIKNLKNESILVAKLKGKVVGFAIYQKSFLNGFYLKLIAVDQTLKGQGIGAKLVAKLEQECFRKKKVLYLCVSHFNRAAQKFYRRLKFEKIGLMKNYSKKGVHEILMRKVKR